MHNLRKADGIGSPTKVKTGRVTKGIPPNEVEQQFTVASPAKMKAGKVLKVETTPSPESWPHEY